MVAKSMAASGLARRTPRDTGPGGQRGTTRKWRRKPLESLETDAEMAPPLRKSAEERAADAAIRGTP